MSFNKLPTKALNDVQILFPAGGQDITFACPARFTQWLLSSTQLHTLSFKNSSDGVTTFPWNWQNCSAGQGRSEHIHLTHKYVISLNRLFTKAPDDVHNLFPVEITFARPVPSKWPLSSTQLHTLSVITSLPEFQWWSEYLTSESTRFPCRPGPLGTHKRLMIPSISASMDCRLSIIVTVSAFTFAPTIVKKKIRFPIRPLQQSPSTPEARRSL